MVALPPKAQMVICSFTRREHLVQVGAAAGVWATGVCRIKLHLRLPVQNVKKHLLRSCASWQLDHQQHTEEPSRISSTNNRGTKSPFSCM